MTTEPINSKASLRDWAAVIGAALGAFMAILDIQVINASLREIQGALSLSMTEGSWITTAYLIAEIIVIPMTGALSAAVGVRRFFVVSTIIFLISSVACGFSWNLESIVFFRILQGLSGGVLIPMSFQAILTKLPLAQRNVGFAVFGLTITLAPTLGPTLGGFLTEQLNWRFIFFINVIPGILVAALLMYGFEKSAVQIKLLKKFDFSGAFFLSLALGSLTYILEEGARKEWFEDFSIQVFFLLFIASFAIFLVIMLLKENPLLRISLLKERNFGLSALITLFAAIALYGGVYATSVYLGQVQGYSAQQIGATIMWIGLPQILVMPLLPFLMNRFDLRLLALVGFSLFMISNFLNCSLDMLYSGDQFRLSLILRALGQPLFMIPLSALAMSRIPQTQIAEASAIYNTIRNIGGSIGICLCSTLLVSRTTQHLQNHVELVDTDSPHLWVDYQPTAESFFSQSMSGWLEAKAMVLRHVLQTAYRDSLIQSFSDAFVVISWGLVLCLIMVLCLKKTSGPASVEGGH